MRRTSQALPHTSALLAFVAVFGLMPTLGQAQAPEPVKGDLAARASSIETLLESDLSDAEAAALFVQLRKLLLERVGSDVVSDADLYLGAMHGMLQAVNERQDALSGPLELALPDEVMVVTAEQAAQLRRDLQGQMTGIGIDFRFFPDHGVLYVMEVLDGSPGDKGGIRPGDRIVAVDGVGFASAPVQLVLDSLQGSEGSPLSLTVMRGEGNKAALFNVPVVRSIFPVRSTRAELTPDRVGWLQLSQLHSGTPAEVLEEITRLRKLGADRFVLDLRGCQGGDVLAMAGVADLFLPPSAVVVRLVEPGVGEQDVVASQPQSVEEEMVVLVNRWTQGAAEALAIALQEHARAYVIGEATMGAARAETLIPLRDDLVLRLDSVRMESPTGRSWQGRGLQPDQPVEVQAVSQPTGPGEAPDGFDQQFQMAVHYFQTARE
ncbi:MAG: PDZ domain-containing protein [Deltaproteobacteria bacterium]|nr:PDZ domain-containing protein [Deltaproteobacteria bacterium]